MLQNLEVLITLWFDAHSSWFTYDHVMVFISVLIASFALWLQWRFRQNGKGEETVSGGRRSLFPIPYLLPRRAYARAFLDRHSKRIVPLASVEITLRLDSRMGANETGRLTLGQLIAALLKHPRADNKIMLIGAMGAGKSVLLRRIALGIASQAARVWCVGAPIPILLSMQDYDGKSIRELLQNSVSGSCRGNVAVRIITSLDRLIDKGRLVVLIDALEEAPQGHSPALTRNLVRFLAETPVPTVLAVRQESALVYALDGLRQAWLEELDDFSVTALIRAEIQDAKDGEAVLAYLQHSGFLVTGGHARNPFWLCAMLEANEYSSRRADVIGVAVENVLKKELHRSHLAEEPVEADLQENIQQLMILLELVSSRMVSNGSSFLERELLPDLLALVAAETGTYDASQDLIDIAVRAMVLRWSSLESEIRFRHQSFKHFFAARWVLRHSAIEKLLDGVRVQNLTEIEYWEIVAFLLELESRSEKPTRALMALTRDDTPRCALVLAIAIAVWPRDHTNKWVSRAKSIIRHCLLQPVSFTNPGVPELVNVQDGSGANVKVLALATTGVLELVNARSNDVLIDLLVEVAQETPAAVGCRAIEVIGNIPSPRTAQVLCRLLKNQNLWESAADELVRLGETALPALSEARASEELRVRANQVLVGIGAPAIPLLRESLRLSDGARGNDAAECLVGIGYDSTPALLEELRVARDEVRQRIVGALARLADPRSLEQLISIAQDESVTPLDLVRLSAITGLGRIKNSRALSALLDISERSAGKRRLTALEAIANQGDPSAIEPLLALHDRLLMVDDNYITPGVVGEERDATLASLMKIGVQFADRVTRDVLMALLTTLSAKSDLRWMRSRKLGDVLAATVSDNTVEDVLDVLTDVRTDEPVRFYLIEAIVKSTRRDLHSMVEGLIETRINTTAGHAETDLVRLLARLTPKEHLPKLLIHLKKRSAEARVALIKELDKPDFHCKPVADALLDMLDMSDDDFGKAREWFLHARLADSVVLLKDYAKNAEGLKAKNRARRIIAFAEVIEDNLPPPGSVDPEILMRMEVIKSTRGLGKILKR